MKVRWFFLKGFGSTGVAWGGLMLCQALGCIPVYPVDLRSAVLSAQLMNRWWCRNLALRYKGGGEESPAPPPQLFFCSDYILLNFIWGGGKRKLSTLNPRHWFPNSHTECGLELIHVSRWLFNCSLETSGEFYPASFILNYSSTEWVMPYGWELWTFTRWIWLGPHPFSLG